MGLNKDEKAYLERVAGAIIESQAKLMADMVARETAHAKEMHEFRVKIESIEFKLQHIWEDVAFIHGATERTLWTNLKVWFHWKRKMDFTFKRKKLLLGEDWFGQKAVEKEPREKLIDELRKIPIAGEVKSA